MKSYRLAELTLGLSHSFEVCITDEMLDAFKSLTGDENILHTDKTFAVSRGYADRVAYGMLTSSFYSTLVGMYLPGRFALLQGIDVSFVSPAYSGETLNVHGEVIEIHEVFKQIVIRAKITNREGHKISKAKIRTGVYE